MRKGFSNTPSYGAPDELAVNDELRAAPWYHVVMEDDIRAVSLCKSTI